MMNEIRWHGRGGQGAKTVSELLALALMHHGDYVQAFPEYGPERSGAPLQAYTRSSDQPIRLHCGVTEPDIVVVLDDSLLREIPVTEGLKPDGFLLINTTASESETRAHLKFDGHLYLIDADRIAKDSGVPYSNVVMAGAVAALMGEPPLKELEIAARKTLGKKLLQKVLKTNIEAIAAGFHATEHMKETI